MTNDSNDPLQALVNQQLKKWVEENPHELRASQPKHQEPYCAPNPPPPPALASSTGSQSTFSFTNIVIGAIIFGFVGVMIFVKAFPPTPAEKQKRERSRQEWQFQQELDAEQRRKKVEDDRFKWRLENARTTEEKAKIIDEYMKSK